MVIKFIKDVGFLLDKLGIVYTFSGDETFISTCFGDENNSTFIIFNIVENHWLYISAVFLVQNPVTDDEKLCLFYKKLLIENNYTKMGRFFIDEEGLIRFGTDILLSAVNEEILKESIDLILYFVEKRLPEIGDPYVDLLFSKK